MKKLNNSLYIGVMSGTSLDGVDVVLCEIDKSTCELKAFLEYPFDEALKKYILGVISQTTTLLQIGEINQRLGLLFSDAINALIKENLIDIHSIKAIGLHGQTLWHEPSGRHPFSMQLGDANIVAVETGIDVVCDFRSKDIALGGQGAPFAPAFHDFIFKGINKKTVVLNIGGMANITLIGDKLLGYDTGCGNVLLDMWIMKNQNTPYDRDGSWAKSAEVNSALLDKFLDEPYFSQNYPKSTGRELFNQEWLNDKLKGFDILTCDVQATLLELSVRTIVDEVKKHDVELTLVCGGGVKNEYMMDRLAEELNHIEVSSTDSYSVSSDYMEAMAFAWLAYKRVNRERVELKDVTGASKNAILGGLYAGN